MKKGFTLIELLAVILIIGILMTIIVPNMIGAIERFKINTFENKLKDIAHASEIYMTNKDNVIPELGLSLLSNTIKFNDSKKIIFGTVKFINNNIYLENISDGTFCGSGYLGNFSIVTGDCSLFDVCYDFDSKTGTITDYNEENEICGTDVVIPSLINGTIVSKLAPNSFNGSVKIKTIYFPYGIEEIGNNSFADNEIEALDLSNLNSIKTIGYGAFSGNPISNVTFSSNPTLNNVGDNAFCASDDLIPVFSNKPIILDGVSLCIE